MLLLSDRSVTSYASWFFIFQSLLRSIVVAALSFHAYDTSWRSRFEWMSNSERTLLVYFSIQSVKVYVNIKCNIARYRQNFKAVILEINRRAWNGHLSPCWSKQESTRTLRKFTNVRCDYEHFYERVSATMFGSPPLPTPTFTNLTPMNGHIRLIWSTLIS